MVISSHKNKLKILCWIDIVRFFVEPQIVSLQKVFFCFIIWSITSSKPKKVHSQEIYKEKTESKIIFLQKLLNSAEKIQNRFFYLSNFNSVTSFIDLKCVRLNFKRINVLTSFIQSSRFPLNTFYIRFFLFLKHKPYS